ncbi:glycosyltransferase family 2 protein [Paenibacillus sedimenti]|uniref:Glycosyltransferase family 2 protein n=1 Tax=Paenibacillus sedimenti TaxID=2770274 RepID=A0A926KQI8_9BACL|nr:glycosyltransferase family 2 protein [Paenibacillus sedimenti]MBD0382217.1 glycosyltransferase family 2 protein [Paenibacillus sedimenti]
MITISLCMIVKNEEKSIGNCLESVKDIADEIIIVDTGSTDRSIEIAKEYTARIIPFQWIEDFSAARNFSFRHASMDYILWLDADDVLLPEDQGKLYGLKKTLNSSFDAVSMIYHYAFDDFGNVSLSFRRNRLVRRDKRFQWNDAVHEYLDVYGNVLDSDVTVTHRRINSSMGRNLAIYEKRMDKGETFSPRDLYYYANELRDNHFYEKAVQYYGMFLNCDQAWVEDKITACDKMADCYYQLGDQEKEKEAIYKSFSYDSPRAEFCCRLGFHFLNKRQFKTAAYWYRSAIQLERPIDGYRFCNESCWTWLPHIQLCICYFHLGDYEKSNSHNEIARTYRPADENIINNKALLEPLLEK